MARSPKMHDSLGHSDLMFLGTVLKKTVRTIQRENSFYSGVLNYYSTDLSFSLSFRMGKISSG